MEDKTTYSGGIGLLGVVKIVFIILKLVGVITWSWLVILIPLWIQLSAIIVMLAVMLVMVLIAYLESKS